MRGNRPRLRPVLPAAGDDPIDHARVRYVDCRSPGRCGSASAASAGRARGIPQPVPVLRRGAPATITPGRCFDSHEVKHSIWKASFQPFPSVLRLCLPVGGGVGNALNESAVVRAARLSRRPNGGCAVVIGPRQMNHSGLSTVERGASRTKLAMAASPAELASEHDTCCREPAKVRRLQPREAGARILRSSLAGAVAEVLDIDEQEVRRRRCGVCRMRRDQRRGGGRSSRRFTPWLSFFFSAGGLMPPLFHPLAPPSGGASPVPARPARGRPRESTSRQRIRSVGHVFGAGRVPWCRPR